MPLHLRCFHCPAFKVNSLDSMMKHLEHECSARFESSSSSDWPCGNCGRQYAEKRCLKRHIQDKHLSRIPFLHPSPCKSSSGSPRRIPNSPMRTPTKFVTAPAVSLSPFQSRRAPTPANLRDVETYLTEQLAVLVSQFHSNPGMTEKSVQSFVESFRSFQQDVLYVTLRQMYDWFDSAGQSCNHLIEFQNTLKIILEKCVVPLSTIHRRFTYFKDNNTYIPPEPVYFTRSSVQSKRGAVEKILAGQFIPVRRVLAKLLSIPNLLKEMDKYVGSLKDPEGGICHYIHSPGWSRVMDGCSFHDSDVIWLPLHLYFDEFEAGNPLGSRRGVNKLGAVYLSIPSLPIRFVSKIKFIFLVMLFHASDMGAFRVDTHDGTPVGNNVFKKVIDEMNFLHDVGVPVQLSPHRTVTVKFSTACLLGDNLALNQICGFVESFRSPYCCRICTDDYRTAPYVEDKSTLRNSENYQENLQLDNIRETGIKERCIWLNMKGFDLFSNTNPDHMHDFLEGACYYVMYEVIKGLKDNIPTFTLANLNTRLKHFTFGPESNAPTEINISADKGGGGKLRKMSANEVRVFVSYFGLLVGDLVEEFDEDFSSTKVVRGRVVEIKPSSPHYDLYLRLVDVLELLSCRRVTKPVAAALTTAVRRLNDAYSEITSRPHIPPKLHFLVHYPSAMLRNGPSISLSSMAFERKHKELKKSLTSIASTINTPLSAAKKIQLQLNSLLVANELPPNRFIPAHLKNIDRSVNRQLIEAFNLPHNTNFKSTKSIESPESISYHIDSIICREFHDDPSTGCFPRFFKIWNIFYSKESDTAIALALPFKTLCWSRHFHAYRVTNTACLDAAEWVDLSNLDFPFPNTYWNSPNGDEFVYMRNSTSHFIY